MGKYAIYLINSTPDCALRLLRHSWLMDSAYNDTFRKEFAAAFEPPCDVDETIQWIEAYLKRVENMVDRLEGVFNDSKVAGTRYSSLSLSALSLGAS